MEEATHGMYGVNPRATFFRDARALSASIGKAMRRPRTYPAFAKELLLTGINAALYPAGLLSEALKIEQQVRLDDRYPRQVALHYLDPEAAATPIVLLHGALHNRSGFIYMKRRFRRYGFRRVDTMNYNVIGHDIPELAQQLHDRLFEVLYVTGANRVHLVAHSLGGLIARYYVQELGGSEKVHTLVTLGTPHQGTYAAILGRGRTARAVRPDSPLIEQLRTGARAIPTRMISYYSNIDSMILPASNAKIAESVLKPRNMLVKDVGHLGLLTSRALIRSVAEQLATLDAPNLSGGLVSPEAKSVPLNRAKGGSGTARAASGQ